MTTGFDKNLESEKDQSFVDKRGPTLLSLSHFILSILCFFAPVKKTYLCDYNLYIYTQYNAINSALSILYTNHVVILSL